MKPDRQTYLSVQPGAEEGRSDGQRGLRLPLLPPHLDQPLGLLGGEQLSEQLGRREPHPGVGVAQVGLDVACRGRQRAGSVQRLNAEGLFT